MLDGVDDVSLRYGDTNALQKGTREGVCCCQLQMMLVFGWLAAAQLPYALPRQQAALKETLTQAQP